MPCLRVGGEEGAAAVLGDSKEEHAALVFVQDVNYAVGVVLVGAEGAFAFEEGFGFRAAALEVVGLDWCGFLAGLGLGGGIFLGR